MNTINYKVTGSGAAAISNAEHRVLDVLIAHVQAACHTKIAQVVIDDQLIHVYNVSGECYGDMTRKRFAEICLMHETAFAGEGVNAN